MLIRTAQLKDMGKIRGEIWLIKILHETVGAHFAKHTRFMVLAVKLVLAR